MNIQEQLNSLIRGNPLSVDTYLREVCKNEHISDTKASMHIYMLKLDGNNRPRTCDFCDYLINRIVDYCIPPSEIRKAKEKDAEYNTTQYTATLFRKAERLFTDLGNTGEVGELALSVLTQSFLHMPQVLCKMVLKTNSEVHYHGADGVYGKYDTETQKYCLYWGEAKIYADVRQALSSCFDSIKTLLTEEGVDGTRKERDMDLFRTNLDFDNPHLEKAIIEYLDPENAHYNMLEYRGVCLVGYNEESYPKDFSRVEDEIFTCIRDKVDGFKQSIQSRLKSRIPLNLFNIEVFLVPFSDVDELRNKSTIDTIVTTHRSDLLEHIRSRQTVTSSSGNEMDYAYTYFLAAYYKYGRVSNSYMSELYGKSLCKEIDEALESALSNAMDLPASIINEAGRIIKLQ